jgi:hypothetical protein
LVEEPSFDAGADRLEPPRLPWAAWIASINGPLRSFAEPEIPRSTAICCNSGSNFAESPPVRRRGVALALVDSEVVGVESSAADNVAVPDSAS